MAKWGWRKKKYICFLCKKTFIQWEFHWQGANGRRGWNAQDNACEKCRIKRNGDVSRAGMERVLAYLRKRKLSSKFLLQRVSQRV